jgi:hypothetical protein
VIRLVWSHSALANTVLGNRACRCAEEERAEPLLSARDDEVGGL